METQYAGGADATTSTTRLRALVADDDDDIRYIVTYALRSLGIDVDEASDGRRAVELARQHDHAVILLDWMMPVMSGLEALQALRAVPGPRRGHVIMLTARTTQADIDVAMAAGADEYQVKPFGVADLLARIRRATGDLRGAE